MLDLKLQGKIPCSEIRKRPKIVDITEYTLKQKWRGAGHTEEEEGDERRRKRRRKTTRKRTKQNKNSKTNKEKKKQKQKTSKFKAFIIPVLSVGPSLAH